MGLGCDAFVWGRAGVCDGFWCFSIQGMPRDSFMLITTTRGRALVF